MSTTDPSPGPAERIAFNHVASTLDSAIAHANALAAASDLTIAFDHVRALADAVNRAIAIDTIRHAEAFEFISQIDGALQAHDLAYACVIAEKLAFILSAGLYFARTRAGSLPVQLAPAAEQTEAKRVVRSAAGLLAAAARMLPAAERARYADEYRSELWELAKAGDGRIGQLRYALRQLRLSPSTGFALRSPRRRSTSP